MYLFLLKTQFNIVYRAGHFVKVYVKIPPCGGVLWQPAQLHSQEQLISCPS